MKKKGQQERDRFLTGSRIHLNVSSAICSTMKSGSMLVGVKIF